MTRSSLLIMERSDVFLSSVAEVTEDKTRVDRTAAKKRKERRNPIARRRRGSIYRVSDGDRSFIPLPISDNELFSSIGHTKIHRITHLELEVINHFRQVVAPNCYQTGVKNFL